MEKLDSYEVRKGRELLRLAEKVKLLRGDYEDDTLYSPIGAMTEDTILKGIRNLISASPYKQAIGDKLLSLGVGCASKLEPSLYCEFIEFLIDIS